MILVEVLRQYCLTGANKSFLMLSDASIQGCRDLCGYLPNRMNKTVATVPGIRSSNAALDNRTQWVPESGDFGPDFLLCGQDPADACSLVRIGLRGNSDNKHIPYRNETRPERGTLPGRINAHRVQHPDRSLDESPAIPQRLWRRKGLCAGLRGIENKRTSYECRVFQVQFQLLSDFKGRTGNAE